MLTADEIKAWAEKRLTQLRADLERTTSTPDETSALRGAITEHKKLLAALENKAPPIWSDAA